MLAYQERVKSGLSKPVDLLPVFDAALTHSNESFRDVFGQSQRRLQRDLKCVQISIIHADDLRARFERRIQLDWS